MRLIIEGPDGKGLFPPKRLELSVGIAASSKSEAWYVGRFLRAPD